MAAYAYPPRPIRDTGAGGRTRTNMNRDTDDWKDADPNIPELIEARERLGEMEAEGVAAR